MPKYEDAKAKNEAALFAAVVAEQSAANASFQNSALIDEAKAKISDWRTTHKFAEDAKKKTVNKSYNYIPSLIGLCVFFILILGSGIHLMGQSF